MGSSPGEGTFFTAWFNYDEAFRQKLSVHPTLNWGVKDVGLWLNLFLPQRPSSVRQIQSSQPTNNSNYRKGICFNFNDGQCKWPNSCKYRHECAFCTGTHPISKCFKKMSANNQQSGMVQKSNYTSEVARYAPLAQNVSRQVDGPAVN